MFLILNQLIILLIFILVIFKLIGRFFTFQGFCVLIDWSVFHIPGVLCVLQNFTLIGNYVFRDLVRLQLIIWPYNFIKSWFLGVKILYKVCRILWDTLCFRKGDGNFVQLFFPLCDHTDHGVRVTIRFVLVEQG